jgi:hypothetical protein
MWIGCWAINTKLITGIAGWVRKIKMSLRGVKRRGNLVVNA